jgi:hypothetical protein
MIMELKEESKDLPLDELGNKIEAHLETIFEDENKQIYITNDMTLEE